MKVYFSGISGTGIGPLAELAYDAGYEVCGSDLMRGAIAPEIDERNISVHYGEQTGEFLRQKQAEGVIDWFVYTSALPADHAELLAAQELGIHTSKRDEFIAKFIEDKKLKMLAVAGTHGKTTTTALLIYAFTRLGIPVSYLIGTTLGWGRGGNYSTDAKYFIYEADEYDRNFLAYHPFVAAITCVDYDHPDIYPTLGDYQGAFAQFEAQSQYVVKNTTVNEKFTLVGKLRRRDASIALEVLQYLRSVDDEINCSDDEIIAVLNDFPGAGRRFERIAEGVYSDYGHHPNEIKATVEMAKELRDRDNYTGLAVIYQPHQNTRQHKVRDGYLDAFNGADKVFWLPTYLTREDPNLEILTPENLISNLRNPEIAEPAELNDDLASKILQLKKQGWLILLLTAGPADGWLRKNFDD